MVPVCLLPRLLDPQLCVGSAFVRESGDLSTALLLSEVSVTILVEMRTRTKPYTGFYSNIFPDLTQKARSGILKFLWQNDPCKAKWAILAKAYSIIRDDHVGEVTLDSFLNLNTDFLGIVESNRYLETMGWELTVDGQSQYTMTRIKSATAAEADISTNYSVNDVVTRCYDMGYVSEDRRIHKPSHNNSGPVMAFAAQPTLIVNESNKIRISGVNTIVIDHSSAKSDDEVSAADSTADTPSPDPSEMSSVAPETFSHIPGVLPVQPFLDTQQKFNNELGANLQLPNVDETGYPFPFNPDMQTPVLNYDAMFAEQFVNYDFDRFLNF